MPILILVAGLLLPRVTIFILWLLTSWFTGIFNNLVWPLLGFIFMPYTLLWYSAVVNMFDGVWGPVQMIVLVFAVLLDLSSGSGGYKHYHTSSVVVHE